MFRRPACFNLILLAGDTMTVTLLRVILDIPTCRGMNLPVLWLATVKELVVNRNVAVNTNDILE
jgi:hypothetical protein